jgi:L-aspartate oxidase
MPVPRYLQPFQTASLPQMFCDVLVIGSGIAGAAAAREAALSGARVLQLSKRERTGGATLWAQGGIAAAELPADSIETHVADTLSAGAGLCHEGVVREVTSAGPKVVATLESLGVRFDRRVDSSAYSLGREGGHSAHRVFRSGGDATGRAIVEALTGALEATAGVRTLEHAFSVDLLTVGDACAGALILHRDELLAVRAGAVVLATGGAGRLFRETTNPAISTGDGVAMAYRAGAEVRDLEFMQFHPTVLYVPGAPRILITEAARGEGALVRDVRGERFLSRYDERAELAPRDVVSRSIVKHMLDHGDTHVLLDLTVVDPELLDRRLPGVVATGRGVGIDVTREPLPIRPAAHYMVGGVACDTEGRTSLPGLFAAGEVTSTGLNGANRLASNSLLECFYVGQKAGEAAGSEASAPAGGAWPELTGEGPGPLAKGIDAADLQRSVKSLVWRLAGVRRDGEGLREARKQLSRWNRLALRRTMPTPEGMVAQNLSILAALVVEAAQLREESRGGHWRADFPERDDRRFHAHVVQRRGRKAEVRPIPAAEATEGP